MTIPVDLYKLSELGTPVLLAVLLYGLAYSISFTADKLFDDGSNPNRIIKGLIPVLMLVGGALIYPWIYDRDIVLDVNHPTAYAVILGAGIGAITVAAYEAKKNLIDMIKKSPPEESPK